MLDETIWSFSRGLIFMLTERRVYLTSHVCHSKGELNIIIFILILQFSKQALWSFSSALLMHWKSFQDHSWTFKNIGGVSWMNWGTLQMRCESFSSVVMHSKCIWNSLKCIWTRFSLSPVFPNRVTNIHSREIWYPSSQHRKFKSWKKIKKKQHVIIKTQYTRHDHESIWEFPHLQGIKFSRMNTRSSYLESDARSLSARCASYYLGVAQIE